MEKEVVVEVEKEVGERWRRKWRRRCRRRWRSLLRENPIIQKSLPCRRHPTKYKKRKMASSFLINSFHLAAECLVLSGLKWKGVVGSAY